MQEFNFSALEWVAFLLKYKDKGSNSNLLQFLGYSSAEKNEWAILNSTSVAKELTPFLANFCLYYLCKHVGPLIFTEQIISKQKKKDSGDSGWVQCWKQNQETTLTNPIIPN